MEILDPSPADEAKAITDITNLPRSALAAIYHAVTGKVEKLSNQTSMALTIIITCRPCYMI